MMSESEDSDCMVVNEIGSEDDEDQDIPHVPDEEEEPLTDQVVEVDKKVTKVQNQVKFVSPTKLKKQNNLPNPQHERVQKVVKLKGDPFGRKKLPIYDLMTDFLRLFIESDTIILVGETGSGKSTQIPQYLKDLNRPGIIGITQPRRVAAVSVAQRVAAETGTELGGIVGYSIRFEDTTSPDTLIKYLTDGMLLREAMWKPLLMNYSTIILDEAHERTMNTDVLFGVVKKAQLKRKKLGFAELKIIVMSATMDADLFKKYFPGSKVIYASGRLHPIESIYSSVPSEDYCFDTLRATVQLHKTLDSSQHILVFLTGQEEIEAGVTYLKKTLDDLVVILPLYGALSNEVQMKVMEIPHPGVRRIILSTNIAETSLTIPGIGVVIDCGHVKEKFHESFHGVDTLKVVKISQAQAWQRMGRAGRVGPGKCYRLYTQEEFNEMKRERIPEILRMNVSGVILQLLKIGITEPISFDWLDSPLLMDMQSAIDDLLEMGAIITRYEPLELTEMGSILAEIPLEPRLAKALIVGAALYVIEPVTAILALLSADFIYDPMASDKTVAIRRQTFFSAEGDLIMYKKMFDAFVNCKKKKFNFCATYGLNYKAFISAVQIKRQLIKFCKSKNIYNEEVEAEFVWEHVRKTFYSAMPFNIGLLERGRVYKIKRPGKPQLFGRLQKESCLVLDGPRVVHFVELSATSSSGSTAENFLKHVSIVNPIWMEDNNQAMLGMEK